VREEESGEDGGNASQYLQSYDAHPGLSRVAVICHIFVEPMPQINKCSSAHKMRMRWSDHHVPRFCFASSHHTDSQARRKHLSDRNGGAD